MQAQSCAIRGTASRRLHCPDQERHRTSHYTRPQQQHVGSRKRSLQWRNNSREAVHGCRWYQCPLPHRATDSFIPWNACPSRFRRLVPQAWCWWLDRSAAHPRCLGRRSVKAVFATASGKLAGRQERSGSESSLSILATVGGREEQGSRHVLPSSEL